jgi:CHAT domain-containing protein/Tfp pilus assembly protein PilF
MSASRLGSVDARAMTAWFSALSVGLSLTVVSATLAFGAGGEVTEDALVRAGRLNAEVVQHIRDGDHREGLLKAREALALREQALGPLHPDVAESLNNLGVLLQATGDYPAARSTFERALAIWEAALGPDHPDVATGLNNLAGLHRRIGDYAAARPLYERALRIRESALDPAHPSVAQSLNNLAVLQEAVGEYQSARTLYQRALTIWEQAFGPAHPDVATGLNNLGLVLEATGDFSAARPMLERALRIRNQVLGPIHPDIAASLNNLGLLLWVTGEYADARPLLEESLVMSEQTHGPSHPDVATAYALLAQFLHSTGDYAAARPLHERALEIRERVLGPAHPDVANSLNALGQLLRDMGDHAAARPLFERALQVREQALGSEHPDVAGILNALAYLLFLDGEYAAAQQLAERGLQIRERAFGPQHPAVAASSTTLAQVLHATGAAAAAWPLYERSLVIARSVLTPEWRRRAALGLGRIYESEGRIAEALLLYDEAVSTSDGLAAHFPDEVPRRQYLGADRRFEAYDALAAVLLKLHQQDPMKGYARRAWAVLEAKKGRVAAEALAEARPKLQDAQARARVENVRAKQDEALALERSLLGELAMSPSDQRPERIQGLTTELARTKAEYLAQVHALLARYPQYKTQFVDQQIVDPRALAKFADRLPAGTLAVQYFAAPEALYIFVVAAGGRFEVKRQAVAQADLYAMIMRYREHLDQGARLHLTWEDNGSEVYNREVAPLKAITRTLSEHLLGPIEAELSAHRQLILVPNDLLLHLPIHALMRSGRDGALHFLAETHVISYVTQLELMDLLSPTRRATYAPLLALGNPDGSLPWASREIQRVRAIRPAVTMLEGRQATKGRFLNLASKFQDLHLATHGVLDPARPERSYLLMAGDDNEDGRLGIDQIAGLTLRSGLAILSACETAVGERVPGAALITLAAAFSQAGSKSIVASLWKVNDSATADLMVDFHRSLRTLDRAAALQRAQVTMMRTADDRHPYYWASFILIGGR